MRLSAMELQRESLRRLESMRLAEIDREIDRIMADARRLARQ